MTKPLPQLCDDVNDIDALTEFAEFVLKMPCLRPQNMPAGTKSYDQIVPPHDLSKADLICEKRTAPTNEYGVHKHRISSRRSYRMEGSV